MRLQILNTLKLWVSQPRVDAGKTAPDSFQDAMRDTESTAFVMWKCNGYKDKCDFSVMNEAIEELRDEPNDLDACNNFQTCHGCISASKDNIKCG